MLKYTFIIFLSFFFLFSSFFPFTAQAGCPLNDQFGIICPGGPIVPCGGHNSDGTDGPLCTVCHIPKLIKNLIDYMIYYIALPLAAVMFTVAGVFFVTAGENPQKVQQAKSLFKSIVIGILIIFLGWTLVDTVIYTLAGGESRAAAEAYCQTRTGWLQQFTECVNRRMRERSSVWSRWQVLPDPAACFGQPILPEYQPPPQSSSNSANTVANTTNTAVNTNSTANSTAGVGCICLGYEQCLPPGSVCSSENGCWETGPCNYTSEISSPPNTSINTSIPGTYTYQGKTCSNCSALVDLGLPFKPPAGFNEGACAIEWQTQGNDCVVNTAVAQKLIALNNSIVSDGNVAFWNITEAWPPVALHNSTCHYNGTCIDANFLLASDKGNARSIVYFINKARTAGLSPVYEVPDNITKENFIKAGVPDSYLLVTGNTQHFHINS